MVFDLLLQKSVGIGKYRPMFEKSVGNGTMAQSWRGGIGKYPPNPERFGNTSRCPEAKPRDKGGIEKTRRMRWVFSNPPEP